MKQFKLFQGDNMISLKKLPDNSIDSIVSDPPYGLSFMGKKWDYDVPSVEFWKEVYRVLKPGGHILSFGGTRTYHRMVVNIEDAGFEIRDQIMWLYGSGFPKSHNIGKAVDKIEGNEREVVGIKENWASFSDPRLKEQGSFMGHVTDRDRTDLDITKGSSPHEGWGTALKPANEPICVARKPLSEKTIAENVLKWGTGGINVDGCRIGSDGGTMKSSDIKPNIDPSSINIGIGDKINIDAGRFPANIIFECICDELVDGGVIKSGSNNRTDKGVVTGNLGFGRGTEVERHTQIQIHTNPECPCYMLDEQSGVSGSKKRTNFKKDNTIWQENTGETDTMSGGFTDKGGASRFFYVAKVSKSERNMGLDGFEDKVIEGRDEGRFPANIIFDESAAEMLDEQSGVVNQGHWPKGSTKGFGEFGGGESSYEGVGPKDKTKSGASRFFYVAKVSKSERNMGLDGFEEKTSGGKGHGLDRRCSYCNTSMLKPEDCKCETPDWITPPKKNTHPTLKPVQLMAYLCRLVTPPNGIVLDPFMGSGSTGIAAQLEGFRFCGMEMDEDYFKIAEARIENYELYRPFVEKKKKK